MRLNFTALRALYVVSFLIAIGINVLLWTEFDKAPLIFKILISLLSVGILAVNARRPVFPRPDR